MDGIAGPDDAISIDPIDSSILFDKQAYPARRVDHASVGTHWIGFDAHRAAVEEDALRTGEMQQQASECRTRSRVGGP